MRWLINIAVAFWLVSAAHAANVLPNGTFNLTDPSTSQSITLTVRGGPNVTFSTPVALQCGITPAGTAVSTATLVNPPTTNTVTWVLTGNTTDFAINASTGVITTVGGMSATCPAGGATTVTATASD